jgi:hypothetical protein
VKRVERANLDGKPFARPEQHFACQLDTRDRAEVGLGPGPA